MALKGEVKFGLTWRKGLSLPEILIFLVLMGMLSATVLPLLFNSSESRQRQDAIALVEQNGAQIMQEITRAIREAEFVLSPPRFYCEPSYTQVCTKDVQCGVGKRCSLKNSTGTGYVLALQMENIENQPTIIAKHEGSLVMIKGRTRQQLNSDLVAVTHFAVDNLSTAKDKQSVSITLNLSRTIRVLQPITYDATFNTIVTLHPDNDLIGDPCNCIMTGVPNCLSGAGSGAYTWGVCDETGTGVYVCTQYTDFQCDLLDED